MNIRTAVVALGAVVLACITACASTFDKLPGEKWTGVSDGPGCVPFRFKVAIHDGEIAGKATTTFHWGIVYWDVSGLVSPSGDVYMRTETTDTRITGYRYATWEGKLGKLTDTNLTIAQPSSAACHRPRKATLTRRSTTRVLALEDRSTAFDGDWRGVMQCGSCPACPGPLEKPVTITVKNGAFDMVPDTSYQGIGAINREGNMRLLGTGRLFHFSGKFDGELFELRGVRGPRTCKITLRRGR